MIELIAAVVFSDRGGRCGNVCEVTTRDRRVSAGRADRRSHR